MRIFKWISDKFNRSGKENETVPYYDVETQQVIQIPPRELRQGTIQAKLEGYDGLVWVLPDQLKMGEINHPPFEEEIRGYIYNIYEVFKEYSTLSLDEWEDGFRRDADPEKEIALWSHAADIYSIFAQNEPSQNRRKDYYKIVVACLTCSPDSIWNVLQLESLNKQEATEFTDRFYGNSNKG